MNIQQLRKIDYWVGIPLCFLFSCFYRLQKIISFNKRKTKPVQKILLIKFSELGAIILAYPLLAKIKKYPAQELFFVTFNRNKEVFNLLGGIVPLANIISVRTHPLFFIWDSLMAIARLRKEKIDMVIDLEFFSRASAIFSYLSGAKNRMGFYPYAYEGLYRGEFLTHKVQYNPLIHISKNYLSFGSLLEQDKKDTPQLETNIDEREIVFPKYLGDPQSKERLLLKIKNQGMVAAKGGLFLINAGEGILPLREWPLENFITLAKLILQDDAHSIILIGTEGAAPKAKVLREKVGSLRCIDLVGKTDLKELLELFNIADALISNDCGLAHLGMLTTIKKFIIFGPESPRVFGPLNGRDLIIYADWPCSPCLSAFNHRESRCGDNACLKAITPEYVYSLIENLLQNSRKYPAPR